MEEHSWPVKEGLDNEGSTRLYLFSLYWSLSTVFTIGFGNIHAWNTIEYSLSIIWMLFGVGFYSFTIGTLTSIIVQMDSRDNILKYKLRILNDYSIETNMDPIIQDRIKKIFAYNSKKNIFCWLDKQEIFNELPANLKCNVSIHSLSN